MLARDRKAKNYVWFFFSPYFGESSFTDGYKWSGCVMVSFALLINRQVLSAGYILQWKMQNQVQSPVRTNHYIIPRITLSDFMLAPGE